MAKRKKGRKLVPVRSGPESKVSQPVMVRLPVALIDDLRATARPKVIGSDPKSGKDLVVWLPVDDDAVPMRALVRDALTRLAHQRIAHNKEMTRRWQMKEMPRTAPKSEFREEVAAALKTGE